MTTCTNPRRHGDTEQISHLRSPISLLLLAACLLAAPALATPVVYRGSNFVGGYLTNSVTVTPYPNANTVTTLGSNFIGGLPVVWVPDATGTYTTNLAPNNYLLEISGIPVSFIVAVPDTNVTINLASNVTSGAGTYSYTNQLNHQVRVNAADTAPGYLGAKVAIAGTLSLHTNANNTVVFSNSASLGSLVLSNSLSTTNVLTATLLASNYATVSNLFLGDGVVSNTLTVSNLFAGTLKVTNAATASNLTAGTLVASNTATISNLFAGALQVSNGLTATSAVLGALTVSNFATLSNLFTGALTVSNGLTATNAVLGALIVSNTARLSNTLTGGLTVSNAASISNLNAGALSVSNRGGFGGLSTTNGLTNWGLHSAALITLTDSNVDLALGNHFRITNSVANAVLWLTNWDVIPTNAQEFHLFVSNAAGSTYTVTNWGGTIAWQNGSAGVGTAGKSDWWTFFKAGRALIGRPPLTNYAAPAF